MDNLVELVEISGPEFLAARGAGDPTVPDRRLDAVAVAQREFSRRFVPFDIANYVVKILSEGDAWVVLFTHKDTSPTAFGSPLGKPGLAVYLDPETLAVVRSHFVR